METAKVDEKSEINDLRQPAAFKGISFSKYKKTDVKSQLEQSLMKGKIEPACYWCAELICSAHYGDIWEILLHYIGKHIHLANPKLIIYLENRYTIFRNIMIQGYYVSELDLRNNPNIRKLFAEVICNLTLSPKKHAFEPIKINRVEEFDITQMTDRLIAPSVKYIVHIFKRKDPQEVFIAMNEFAYNISNERKNMMTACYWIEWIIEFESICKNKKEPCFCEKRSEVPVEKKYQCDLIWMVWDVFFYTIEQIPNFEFHAKILKSVFQLFCVKYTSASPKKRRFLLYFAVALFTEPVPTTIEIATNKEILHMVVEKIDQIYKQIKKNEESPGTDYLFSNIDSKDNFNNSVRRMQIMENIDLFSKKE